MDARHLATSTTDAEDHVTTRSTSRHDDPAHPTGDSGPGDDSGVTSETAAMNVRILASSPDGAGRA